VPGDEKSTSSPTRSKWSMLLLNFAIPANIDESGNRIRSSTRGRLSLTNWAWITFENSTKHVLIFLPFSFQEGKYLDEGAVGHFFIETA
jgi:hypothetical protein